MVNARTVRESGCALRQATSDLKGSMRRARGGRTKLNVQEVEASRADLRKALATAALVKRRAVARGLEVTNLLQDISGAEKRLGEQSDPPSSLPSERDPAAMAASFTPLYGDSPLEDQSNRIEALASFSDDAVSWLHRDGGGSHSSSHESRLLDLEEQEVRL